MTVRLRWEATIVYRTASGPIDVVHYLRELGDIHDVVEAGPHWDTIEKITIVRAETMIADLTVEQAETL